MKSTSKLRMGRDRLALLSKDHKLAVTNYLSSMLEENEAEFVVGNIPAGNWYSFVYVLTTFDKFGDMPFREFNGRVKADLDGRRYKKV